jgi:surface polysaccharide O-acyltransferase-like enzyme
VAQGPWYLVALFIFSLVVPIAHIERGRFVDVLKVIALVLIAYVPFKVNPLPDWHLWANVNRLLPFYALGYLMNVNGDWRRGSSKVPSAVLALVYAVSLLVLWPIWGSHMLLGALQTTAFLGENTEHAVFVIGWGSIFIAGLCGTLLIERAFRKVRGRTAEILRNVGSQSLGIYLIHSIFIRAWPGTGYGAVATSFTVALVASYWLTVAVSRIRPVRIVLFGGR